jgi:hypothetical protein
MAHPLDGARKRVERADKHLKEIVSELEAFTAAEYDKIIVEHDHVRNQPNFIETEGPGELPNNIPLAVSDCIHNFRAALDYLIYELARHDSGAIQRGTQFPIADKRPAFRKLAPTYLRGLTPAHINMVEMYQPYKGVNWTKTLRDISNPDKHRHLTLVRGDRVHSIAVKEMPDSLEGRPGKVFKGVGRDRSDVYVERNLSVYIAFSDGVPVIETLEIMKSQVARTIEAFEPEF